MALLNYSAPFANIQTPIPFNYPQYGPPPVPQQLPNNVAPNPYNTPYNSYLPAKTEQKQYSNNNPVPQFGFNVPQFKDNVPTPSVDLSPNNDDGVIPPLLTEKELLEQQQKYPQRQIQYKKIDLSKQKTSIHPIIDYDNDYEYYDDDTGQPAKPKLPHVTPIQGPIYLKNNSVPVVPLYSYPLLNNGSFVQIPILWTALSVALGWELHGEIIRGVPCIKRYHQLFCPTAGNSYPIDKIELFIDENKALMKRMYGDFTMNPETNPAASSRKNKRHTRATKHHHHHYNENNKTLPGWVNDIHTEPISDPLLSGGDSYFAKLRKKRQSSRPPSSAIPNLRGNQSNDSGRLDACESKVEIVTPYWASNSAGKVRAIVNTQHFEQAIHQEVCSKTSTSRCANDCGCEQKYKWHRLLAYDPDEDCKGIFMDWFLFPSCCVCRCNPR